MAIAAIGLGNPRLAEAQDAAGAVEPVAEPAVDACASDPKVLGLERIVEIDATDGPVFGGGHPRETFLNDKEVVLTFDDGPLRPYTRPVLKALAAHCTKATFFMVGRMAAADPGLVKEIMAAGHTVGSHTWSHQNLKALQYFKARGEFEMGLSAVTKAAGKPIAPFFRFPYLSDNRMIRSYVRQRHAATFFIDINSKDFQTRNSSLVFDKIMHDLERERKGIILMHDIQPSTAGMIGRLLSALHAKGYKVVHMVPKQGAGTLAEFDGGAAKALKAKADALQAKPLADRSMVWTMSPEHQGEPRPRTSPVASTPRSEAPPVAAPAQISTGSTTAATTGAATTTAPEAGGGTNSNGEVLPWSQTVAPPAPAAKKPAPARKQVHRQAEDLPWQLHIFQN